MTPRELAAAIRKGHTMIGESRNEYLTKDCGCAIGAALAADGVSYDMWIAALVVANGKGYETAAKLLGVEADIMRKVNTKHCGGTPRLAIADWLDTLDVSKPKDAQTFNDFMAATLRAVEIPMDSDTTPSVTHK